MVIPGQNWQLSFDAPPLAKQKETNYPDQYTYFGNSGRFNLSLYVETPGCNGGNTHEAFYKCFWPNASRNPTIVKKSVNATSGSTYYKVVYDIEVPWKGELIRQHNINFLIAFRGKWTDLHVSVVNPTEADLKMLEAFEKSLGYSESR
jgi:hypothetical protein